MATGFYVRGTKNFIGGYSVDSGRAVVEAETPEEALELLRKRELAWSEDQDDQDYIYLSGPLYCFSTLAEAETHDLSRAVPVVISTA